jgi:hypothetical protein
MTEPVETSGKTVEEAIDRALEILGATDDEVEIQVLSEGGDMVKLDDARVRVRLRDERGPEASDEDYDDYEDELEDDDDFEPDELIEANARRAEDRSAAGDHPIGGPAAGRIARGGQPGRRGVSGPAPGDPGAARSLGGGQSKALR